jgi:Ca2+-binding EF-hand superfamily protein
MNEDFIHDINKFKDAFEFFDSDKDGFITQNDIKNFLDKFEFEYKDSQIAECVKNIDFDNDGKISYEDFEKLMYVDNNMSKEKKIEELNEIFKIFDKYGNQKLKISDFSEVLKKLGENLLTDEEIQIMLEGCDLDGDNFIDINEFMKMMMN